MRCVEILDYTQILVIEKIFMADIIDFPKSFKQQEDDNFKKLVMDIVSEVEKFEMPTFSFTGNMDATTENAIHEAILIFTEEHKIRTLKAIGRAIERSFEFKDSEGHISK